MSTSDAGYGRPKLRLARILAEAILLGAVIGLIAAANGWTPAVAALDGLRTAASLIRSINHAWFADRPAAIGDHRPVGPVGATRYAADYDGLVLAATGGPEITLIDAAGAVRHRWRVPVETLFTVPSLLHAEDVAIDGYRLLPDGSLIAILSYEADFPAFRWGDNPMNTVMAKVDAQSSLIWAYQGNPHHDLALAEAGDLYVLVARMGVRRTPDQAFLPSSFRDEGIAVLDAAGHEKKTIWLSKALAASPYALLTVEYAWDQCYQNDQYCWDLFHANSIEVISPEVAAKLPAAEPGDLLVNLRALDCVAVIDPVREQVRWAMHGAWHRAHDVHTTATGSLIMFDNFGDLRGRRPSRILEVDPRNGATLWQYDGGKNHAFYSSIRGTAEPLANGDVLVTESMGGRIFEVSRAGELVWEYVSPPARNAEAAPVLSGARQIAAADYPFLAGSATGPVANPVDDHPPPK